MCKPATDVYATTQQAASLTRADALEREITDLCARIVEHPQLPNACATDGLRNSLFAARGQPIDAADWIIPAGLLNLDFAVSGFMRIVKNGKEVAPYTE